MFHNDMWPTSDGTVPFKMFYHLLKTSDNVLARRKLLMVEAVALGHAQSMNGKDSKLKRVIKKLHKKAYPEV